MDCFTLVFLSVCVCDQLNELSIFAAAVAAAQKRYSSCT